jgi:hypothetical protein
MSLVPSLLQAIVQVDGEALVMHAGDKPYVVAPTGQVDLATRGLTLDAVNGIVLQLLPPEVHSALDEFGAAQYELPANPAFPGEHFTVVAARGGDDVWAEIRRRRVVDDDQIPEDLFAQPKAQPAAEPEPVAVAAGPVNAVSEVSIPVSAAPAAPVMYAAVESRRVETFAPPAPPPAESPWRGAVNVDDDDDGLAMPAADHFWSDRAAQSINIDDDDDDDRDLDGLDDLAIPPLSEMPAPEAQAHVAASPTPTEWAPTPFTPAVPPPIAAPIEAAPMSAIAPSVGFGEPRVSEIVQEPVWEASAPVFEPAVEQPAAESVAPPTAVDPVTPPAVDEPLTPPAVFEPVTPPAEVEPEPIVAREREPVPAPPSVIETVTSEPAPVVAIESPVIERADPAAVESPFVEWAPVDRIDTRVDAIESTPAAAAEPEPAREAEHETPPPFEAPVVEPELPHMPARQSFVLIPQPFVFTPAPPAATPPEPATEPAPAPEPFVAPEPLVPPPAPMAASDAAAEPEPIDAPEAAPAEDYGVPKLRARSSIWSVLESMMPSRFEPAPEPPAVAEPPAATLQPEVVVAPEVSPFVPPPPVEVFEPQAVAEQPNETAIDDDVYELTASPTTTAPEAEVDLTLNAIDVAAEEAAAQTPTFELPFAAKPVAPAEPAMEFMVAAATEEPSTPSARVEAPSEPESTWSEPSYDAASVDPEPAPFVEPDVPFTTMTPPEPPAMEAPIASAPAPHVTEPPVVAAPEVPKAPAIEPTVTERIVPPSSPSVPPRAVPPPPAPVMPMARFSIRSETPPPLGGQTYFGLDRLLRVAAARGASTLYISSDTRP